MHTAKNVSYANTLYTAFVLCTNPTLEHPDDKEGKNTDDHSESGPTVSLGPQRVEPHSELGPYYESDSMVSQGLKGEYGSRTFSLQPLSFLATANKSL